MIKICYQKSMYKWMIVAALALRYAECIALAEKVRPVWLLRPFSSDTFDFLERFSSNRSSAVTSQGFFPKVFSLILSLFRAAHEKGILLL